MRQGYSSLLKISPEIFVAQFLQGRDRVGACGSLEF